MYRWLWASKTADAWVGSAIARMSFSTRFLAKFVTSPSPGWMVTSYPNAAGLMAYRPERPRNVRLFGVSAIEYGDTVPTPVGILCHVTSDSGSKPRHTHTLCS